MMERRELTELAEFATGVAREAGEIAQRYFKSSFKTERKADRSFVTEADRKAERHIRDAVAKTFPQDHVVGEEEGEQVGSTNRRWIIDPIDGTYSFVHGVPLYGVLIGLEIADEPVLGVVNLPGLDEMVYAAKGFGCFWNDKPARVSATAELRDALLLITDFGAIEDQAHGAAIGALQRNVNARRTWGDAYGHVLVATGRADIMLDPVMNVWDCAPLLPILEEAGGTFTDWQGRRTIRGGNAISTNGVLFEAVMKTIRES